MLGGEGREWSQRLGVATFELMFRILGELLSNGCPVVAEGNFSRAEPFRALPPAEIVQVHVSAQPDVLIERYRARKRPHPVHYDETVVDELPARIAAGEWAPLDIGGRLVEVDTTHTVDVQSLVRVIRPNEGSNPSFGV